MWHEKLKKKIPGKQKIFTEAAVKGFYTLWTAAKSLDPVTEFDPFRL